MAVSGKEGGTVAFDSLAVAVRETRYEPVVLVQGSSRGPMDWNDVRVFLAVAREGSMRAAGRALGLSQPTIARRLAAFEASFGGPTLFDRLPEGLRLNAAGEQLVAEAESVEDAVLTLERRRAAASPVLSGTVRISTGECAAGFLARSLSGSTTTAFRRASLWNSSSRDRRQTSRAAKPIWRCATSRRKAVNSTFPRQAPSPVRSIGVAARMPMHGSPIPTSKRTMRPRAGSSGS